MENKDLNSIEFFWKQLKENLPFSINLETSIKLTNAYNMSKYLHQIEIERAYNQSARDILSGNYKGMTNYYNETFNNNEQ